MKLTLRKIFTKLSDFVNLVRIETRLASSGKRFGSGRISLLLRLLLRTEPSEVYREDILHFSQYSGSYDTTELVATPSDVPTVDISREERHDFSSTSGSDSLNLGANKSPTLVNPQLDHPYTLAQSNASSVQSSLRRPHIIKYLSICFRSMDCVRLSHIEVRILNDSQEDDELIFGRMRAVYNARRGSIRRLVSIFEIKKIKLIKVGFRIFQRTKLLKFRLFWSNLVEVLQEVESSNFSFAELTHNFYNPECRRESTWYRSRLPLYDEPILKLPEILQSPEAVSLYLVEKPSIFRLIALCVGYFVITLVFGITWWVVRDDIQGAFDAASYFASFVGVVSLMVVIVVSYID